jgi:predicted ABC-class ATPase
VAISCLGVDISPFIDNLPEAANMDPRSFSTNSASGSNSMAANIVESMELKSEVFLLDEDTCAR